MLRFLAENINNNIVNAVIAIIIFLIGLIIILLAFIIVNRKNQKVISKEEMMVIELYQSGKISYQEYRNAIMKIRYQEDNNEKNN